MSNKKKSLENAYEFCSELLDLLIKKDESDDELTQEEKNYLYALETINGVLNNGLALGIQQMWAPSQEDVLAALNEIELDRIAEIFEMSFDALQDIECSRGDFIDDDDYFDYVDEVYSRVNFPKLEKELDECLDEAYLLFHKYAFNNIAPFKYAKEVNY